ncbi:hypothetical protein HY640_02865 [Candidatus Woesearchaeota archaeon]|nr:hypothetical protein [Candidatus Woesearchaeota archaeon]
MNPALIKKYEDMKKAYRLPSLNEIDTEFDIAKIDENGNIIREIREKIAEKIQAACDILSMVLHPDTDINSLYESRVFEEEQKKEMFESYKRLMSTKRQADFLYMLNDEKADAEFIAQALAFWISEKKNVATVISQLRDSWSKDIEPSDRLAYLG